MSGAAAGPARSTENARSARLLRRKLRAGSWLAVAVVVAGLAAVSLVRNAGWTEPDDGAAWADIGGSILLVEVAPGGPASIAGLRSGDLLESIDGRKVRSAAAAKNRLWDAAPGKPLSYQILREGSPVNAVLLPAEDAPSGNVLFPYLALVGLFFLCTGTYAAMRLPANRLAGLFFVLCLAMAAVLAVSDSSRAASIDWLLFWIDRAGRLIAPAVFVHFVLSFVRREGGVPLKTRLAIYAPAALLGAANVVLVAGGRAASLADPVGALEAKDRIELAWMAFCWLGGTASLATAYLRDPSRSRRRQLRWMMWGAIVGLGPFSVFYLLPVAAGLPGSIWGAASALPMVVLPLSFASALLRYRLSDFGVFLKRGVAGLSVVFFTLAAFMILTLIVERTAGAWLRLPGVGVTGFAALLTALIYPRIRDLTHALVDRIFYREKYDVRRTLVSFGRELNSELDLDVLVRRIEERVRHTMDFDRIALYLRTISGDSFGRATDSECGPESLRADVELLDRVRDLSWLSVQDLPPGSEAAASLRAARVSVLFPMKVKGEVRALLAVGRRRDGEPLTSEDVEMLVVLCGQAASALEAARLLRRLREKVGEVERLRRTNEDILESSGVAILVLDPEGRVRNSNRAFEALAGVSRERATGRLMSQLYPLPFVREVEQLIARAESGTEGSSPRTFRSSITGGQGERVRANLAVSPLAAEGAEGAGWVVTIDDVTEQVRLEERLLRQDRLAAIGLLASGVAHEVNTPLTGISSYAQLMLAETKESDPRHDLLRKIEKQTTRASTIANTLLNFSRGEDDETTEPLDLAEVLEEAVALFEPQLRGGGIRLEREIEPRLPSVPGHRGKLQQVILNLLLNARDAVEGDGRIGLTLRRTGGHVALSVSDDGCGIAEEDISRVFDPFFTTKGRGHGTGLGLSLSYNIVREHGGEMGVESRRGEGTIFTVELPVRESGEDVSAEKLGAAR